MSKFIKRISPQLPPPQHIQQVISIIERTRHEEIRCTISMPPRHVKTVTCLHGIAWRLKRDPACTNGYCTYSKELSYSKSRMARNFARNARINMSSDMQNLAEWRTREGGGLLATGVGGGLTGKGIQGVLIADDLIKNREEANSKLVRDKVWDWFNDVAYTRLEPGSSCLVVGTRWHEDDIIGRLHSNEYEHDKWEEINIPAVSSLENEPADERLLDKDGHIIHNTFADGVRALWPDQYPLERLAAIRKQIGEYAWASLYQGMPVPRGARVFNLEPARFSLKDFSLDGHRLIIFLDPAASEKTHADYSAIIVLAVKGQGENAEGWVLEMVRGQWTIPVVVDIVYKMQRKWQALLGVEAAGGFKAVPQMLRQINPNLRIFEIQPRGDKFTRAQPVAAAWNTGRLYVPYDGEVDWINDFLEECYAFTGIKDAHDDQIDTLAHAWNTLTELVTKVRRGVKIAPARYGLAT